PRPTLAVAMKELQAHHARLNYLIRKRTDSVYPDRDQIASLQPLLGLIRAGDPMRCTSENYRSRYKGGARAQELDDRRNVEDHVACMCVLHQLVVHPGTYSEIIGVLDLVCRDEYRP